MTPHRHLDPARPEDLDLLADVLAGEAERPECPTCQRVLATLAAADLVVSAELAAVASAPVPEPPADLDSRLRAALTGMRPSGEDLPTSPSAADPRSAAPRGASVTTLPPLEERAVRAAPRRWLPAAAAAVVIAGGGTLAVVSMTDGSDSATTAATEASGLSGLVRNDTGTAYSATSLAAAVPGLLAGTAPTAVAKEQQATTLDGAGPSPAGGSAVGPGAPAAPEPSGSTTTSGSAAAGGSSGSDLRAVADSDLDRLRATDGLAGCLSALLPPDEEGQPDTAPLALDYGTFAGQPAMLVLLPVPALPRKVDVFVVGASCAPEDEALLYFARVDRPAG